MGGIIENPDGAPPHLEVFPAIGRLSWIAWFCEVLCDAQLSVFFQDGEYTVMRDFDRFIICL